MKDGAGIDLNADYYAPTAADPATASIAARCTCNEIDCDSLWPDGPGELAERRCPVCGTVPELINRSTATPRTPLPRPDVAPSGPSPRKHESRGLNMTNPLHKLHAAGLEYTSNAEGWSGVDGYTDDYLSRIGRAVLVSCPTCEDELPNVAHAQGVPGCRRCLDRKTRASDTIFFFFFFFFFKKKTNMHQGSNNQFRGRS